MRAFDGASWGDGSVHSDLADTAPVAAVTDQTAQPDDGCHCRTACATWYTSDADSDAITQYQFYDAGAAANGGYSGPRVGQRATNTYITVAADDLDTTSVRGGAAGHKLMWVRGFDGSESSAWDPFNSTP